MERTHTKDFYWQWDNMLKWNKTFGKHAFDFTFLANWEKFQRWHDEMTNENFPTDELGYGGSGFGTSPNYPVMMSTVQEETPLWDVCTMYTTSVT